VSLKLCLSDLRLLTVCYKISVVSGVGNVSLVTEGLAGLITGFSCNKLLVDLASDLDSNSIGGVMPLLS
jgi:hypothetical protein